MQNCRPREAHAQAQDTIGGPVPATALVYHACYINISRLAFSTAAQGRRDLHRGAGRRVAGSRRRRDAPAALCITHYDYRGGAFAGPVRYEHMNIDETTTRTDTDTGRTPHKDKG